MHLLIGKCWRYLSNRTKAAQYIKVSRLYNILYKLPIISVLLGLAFGFFRLRFFDIHTINQLSHMLTSHIYNLTNQNPNIISAAISAIIIYGRIWLVLWFCRFFKKGFYIGAMVLFLRGQALGFSAALLVGIYSYFGFVYVLLLYSLQNIVAFWLYFSILNGRFISIFNTFIVSIFCISIIVFLEVIIVPLFLQFII